MYDVYVCWFMYECYAMYVGMYDATVGLYVICVSVCNECYVMCVCK